MMVQSFDFLLCISHKAAALSVLGHGGRQIVDFMEEVLESNVKKELEVADQASIPERLARSFLITDMQSKSCNITTSGATAVVALIQSKQTANGISEKKLYCANVGDSRAVLACQFSHDCEYVCHWYHLSIVHVLFFRLENLN
jgi:serine/threonine protein phosphatase PrpC